MSFTYYLIIGAGSLTCASLATFSIFFGKKRKIKKSFLNLKNKFQTINNSNIEAKINKIKKISENNEDYVSIYNEVNEKYINLIDNYALEMETKFNKIDVLIANKEYKIIKEELAEVEKSIKNYEHELTEIDKEITGVTSKEDDLRCVVVPLKEQFRVLKAGFYEHKEELSVCSKNFEEKISDLEKNIANLDGKLENGYYKEAQELINEIKKDIDFYEVHLEKMPRIVSFSMQVLPKRLEQAINKYQRMKEEGYPLFSIKVSTIEEKIKTALEEIRVRFIAFNYDDINDSIKEVAYEIENLNEALEKEVSAKDNFSKYIDEVYENIDGIGKKFLKAKRDTNSIKGVFLIDEVKYNELGILENQIHILNRIKMELDAYIHSATKQPYSILTAKMGELAEFGSEVEEKLNDYQAYIISLKTDTEYSYNKVNTYSSEITKEYNTLLGLNHKILSTIYEDKYNNVVSLIQTINKDITTKPVDVNAINSSCQILINSAEKLLQEMRNSLKMYNMAQNIIVFTNKYRSSFTTVNEVLNRAQIHFENGEFEFAIDSVSEVLQEVHPKAYEEMMRRKGYKDE